MNDPQQADELVAELIREIDLKHQDADRDLAMAERELDDIAANAIVRAFSDRGVDELPVRVVPAATDVHWSRTRHWHDFDPERAVPCQDWACPHRRGGCDLGRIGVLRVLPEHRHHGGWSVYIEDMSPGDDGNPTRYLSARHIAVLEDAS